MSENTTKPVAPETSAFNPFNMLGGLVSDIIEVTKKVGSEASDIPQALADGFNNGMLIDTENSTALKEQAKQDANTIEAETVDTKFPPA